MSYVSQRLEASPPHPVARDLPDTLREAQKLKRDLAKPYNSAGGAQQVFCGARHLSKSIERR